MGKNHASQYANFGSLPVNNDNISNIAMRKYIINVFFKIRLLFPIFLY